MGGTCIVLAATAIEDAGKMKFGSSSIRVANSFADTPGYRDDTACP
jgi:hypothetical protein